MVSEHTSLYVTALIFRFRDTFPNASSSIFFPILEGIYASDILFDTVITSNPGQVIGRGYWIPGKSLEHP